MFLGKPTQRRDLKGFTYLYSVLSIQSLMCSGNFLESIFNKYNNNYV